MKVCKSELRQCNDILIFAVKIIPKTKTLHCSQINANIASLSNHSESLSIINEAHSNLLKREYHVIYVFAV